MPKKTIVLITICFNSIPVIPKVPAICSRYAAAKFTHVSKSTDKTYVRFISVVEYIKLIALSVELVNVRHR